MVKTVKWKIWKKREGKKQFIQSFQALESGVERRGKNADKEKIPSLFRDVKNLQTFHKMRKQKNSINLAEKISQITEMRI